MRDTSKKGISAAALAAVLPLALAGCGSASDAGASDHTLTVFAAASLTDTFQTIGAAFEKAHPGTRVKFSFGGSSDLVQQIENGAPADVIASADQATMDRLSAAENGVEFASNSLEIAVPPGNPAKVSGLADLARKDVKTVVCAAPVPCGSATALLEQKAGVRIEPVSEEQSVTDVLGKVESGEADAGIVYVTDVKGAGAKVVGVPIPASTNVTNTDVISVVGSTTQQRLAEQFVDYVATGPGQQVLADAGFAKP
ncbi:MAG TPA: molybdate ABC transporter substrate-binding protein [Marmoricola sp.]|nr:molybdate ABC transporter substrate-binding protein [Marmoricola sp.]